MRRGELAGLGLVAGLLAIRCPAYECHINCGGPEYTAVDGTAYLADQGYTPENCAGYVGGSTGWTYQAILGTADPVLYQTERWSNTEYRFDVPNGLYDVTLRFTEFFYSSVSARVFSVWVEGRKAITNLDIYQKVGRYVALDCRLVAEVSDGQLDIQAQSSRDWPKFSAISVKSVVTPQPQEMSLKGFDVPLGGSWRVVCRTSDPDDRFAAGDLTNDLARLGLCVQIVDITAMPEQPCIVLANPVCDPSVQTLCASCGLYVGPELGSEGYLLDISATGIVICAPTAAGMFYGAQTLKQLLTQGEGTVFARAVRIRDWPDRPVRALQFCGITLEPGDPNYVYSKLNAMARFKMNMAVFEAALFFDPPSEWGECEALFAYCRQRHIEPVPCLQSFGNSWHLLQIDPLCAEGVEVKEELFVFHDDYAEPVSALDCTPPNAGFEMDADGNSVPDGWTFTNDRDDWSWDPSVFHAGSHSVRVSVPGPVAANSSCLVSSMTNAMPDTVYRLAFWAKAEGLGGTYPPAMRVAELDAGGAWIRQHSVSIAAGPWQRYASRFVTATNCARIYVYANIWDGYGTAWFDDVDLRRLSGALLHVIRSENTDIVVTDTNRSRTYTAGVDYEVIDGALAFPFDSETSPTLLHRLAGGAIFPGQGALVSYDFAVRIEGAAPYCPCEPRTRRAMHSAISNVITILHPRFIHIGHDEIRGMNRDSRCRKSGKSNAQLLAEDVNDLNDFAHALDPAIEMQMWDDMINPWHNGGDASYQVLYGGPPGRTDGATDLIERDVVPVIWWYDDTDWLDKMANSPAYFAGKGFRFMVSPWFRMRNIIMWADLLRARGDGLGWMGTSWPDVSAEVRWKGLAPTADYAWCFRPNPIAVASTTESLDTQAGNAVDGDPNTRWSSQFYDPQWIYLDFIRPKAFDTVRLDWEAAYGRQYEIQVSDDASTWVTVYSETNGNGGVDVADVGLHTNRFLRVDGTQRATSWGYSLWEIKADSSSLRAHWPLDEAGGAAVEDQSAWLNQGTVVGASRCPGWAGPALSFDGADDYVVVPDAPSLNPLNALTVSLCFQFYSVPAWWNRLLSKGQWAADNSRTSYLIPTGKDVPTVAFQVYLEGGVIHTVWSSSLEINRWYRLTGTYRSGQLRLFIDGQLVAEDTNAVGRLQRVAEPVCLGANSAYTENFHGVIDEVCIYGRALTPEEVAGQDTDADGIPDSDEGGSTPYAVGVDDRAVDSDGDGMSNAAEYLAGTGPGDPASYLAATGGSRDAGEAFVIEWPSATGRQYTLERSTDLAESFMAIASDLEACPPSNVYTDRVSGIGPRYYRVKARK